MVDDNGTIIGQEDWLSGCPIEHCGCSSVPGHYEGYVALPDAVAAY
jgi:hypothetical protein